MLYVRPPLYRALRLLGTPTALQFAYYLACSGSRGEVVQEMVAWARDVLRRKPRTVYLWLKSFRVVGLVEVANTGYPRRYRATDNLLRLVSALQITWDDFDNPQVGRFVTSTPAKPLPEHLRPDTPADLQRYTDMVLQDRAKRRQA